MSCVVLLVYILGNFTTSDSTTYDGGGNISNDLKLYGDQQMWNCKTNMTSKLLPTLSKRNATLPFLTKMQTRLTVSRVKHLLELHRLCALDAVMIPYNV